MTVIVFFCPFLVLHFQVSYNAASGKPIHLSSFWGPLYPLLEQVVERLFREMVVLNMLKMKGECLLYPVG